MTPLMPLDAEILNTLLNHFQKSALIVSGLVSLIFTARIVLLSLSLAGVYSYGELINETIQYFIFVGLFPQIFKVLNEVIRSLAMRLYWEPVIDKPGVIDELIKSIKEAYPMINILMSLAPSLVCNLAQAVLTLLISVLVALGPLVILLNTLLNFHGGVQKYFAALLSFCLWPVLWNLLGSLANEILPSFSDTSFLRLMFWITVLALQLISPVICISLLSTLAPGKSIGTGVTALATKVGGI